MVPVPLLILASLMVGLGLLWVVMRIVNRRHLLAEVDHRSSHDTPTPTMGGIVIVLMTVAYLLTTTPQHVQLFWFCGALTLVAFSGLWDDLKDLGSGRRFVVQIVAAAIGLWAFGVEAGVFGLVLLIAVVWFTNLYNFMDGIDGIAAVQCLTFCAGVQILSGGVPGWSGGLLWQLSGVTLAFLAYNWPPARIFMGDVGSGFLGLLIALMSYHFWQSDILPLVGSLILLAGFWFDASYTLGVRIITGQPFTQAHRSHLYQRLAERKGHQWTTVAFLLFSILWLLPLAWFATSYPRYQIYTLLVALTPLAIMSWTFSAGARVEK